MAIKMGDIRQLSALKPVARSVGSALQAGKRPAGAGWRSLLSIPLRAWPLLQNLKGHFEFASIISRPPAAGLWERNPRLLYKYLCNYLARGLSPDERLRILSNHYRYLEGRVGSSFLQQIFDDDLPLWIEVRDKDIVSICLCYPREHDFEGDLCLVFKINGAPLYEMSATIAPGPLFGIADTQVFLISQIQGATGNIDLIRHATRQCNGSSPAYLLLNAAEAMAGMLDIHALIGLSTKRQPSTGYLADISSFFDYDQFWQSLCARQTGGGYYAISLPTVSKPLSEIRSNRRSRAMQRRDMKRHIMDGVQASLTEYLNAEKLPKQEPQNCNAGIWPEERAGIDKIDGADGKLNKAEMSESGKRSLP